MRKITAIFLTLILLFNMLGFYGVFVGVKYQNKQTLIQKLDVDEYDASSTVTLKIPITIPYATYSKEYERVDGEFEYQGEFYHLVKQRLDQDTLFIVCIKDTKSKQIHQALSDYVKTFTDKPSDAQQTGKISLNFLKEYIFESFEIKNLSSGWSTSTCLNSATVVFIDNFSTSIVHPPERA